MKYLILTLICLKVSIAQAAFQKIWQGFLISEPNQIAEVDKKITSANFELQMEKFDWSLSLGASNQKANLASLVSFQTQETTTNGLTLGLNKKSYRFGEFAFSHTQLTYDLSEWTNRSFLPTNADTLYEVKNVLSYKYDILDKSSNYDYEIIGITKEQSELKNEYDQQKLYLDFFKTYIQAKLDVFNVRLTKEFKARAQKRVNIVRRRVRDGLSREVESLQAQASLLQQEETLNTARVSLKSNLAILENILKFKLEDAFFAEIKWDKYGMDYWQTTFENNKNTQIQYLEKSLEKSDTELDKLDNQNGMKLKLGADYIANAVTDSAGESFSDASGAGENKSQAISLTLTIPLGLDKNDALKSTILLNRRKNTLELAQANDDIQIQKEALREQIAYLDTAHEIALKKIAISRETEKEQNKLYLRGQSSFEEVIRAEEAFVAAKLSEKKILAQYELLMAQYAFIHNGITNFLTKYTD